MRHSTPERKTAMQCTYTYTLALIMKNPSGGRWDKKGQQKIAGPRRKCSHMCSFLALRFLALGRGSLCVYLPLESSIEPIACGTGVNRVTTLHTYFSNCVNQVAKTLA